MATTPRRAPEDVRSQITRAAIRVIGDQGIGALTHRAVAAEAGVSLSSTTYHFASKQAIVAAALRRFADADQRRVAREFDQLREAIDAGDPPSPEVLVELLARESTPDELRIARTGYELQLQAVADPALQPIARDWFDAIAAMTAEVLVALGSEQPELDARILLAATDGLRLDALTTAASPAREAQRRDTLARLLALLSRGNE